MITTAGKIYIKRYLAGQVGTIGDSIALGIGQGAENSADTILNFELERADITLISYDFSTDKLIFKAQLPDELAAQIYEVGLYSQDINSRAGQYGSRPLVIFESTEETWTGTATFSPTFARAGVEALMHNPSASATSTATMTDSFIDLSGNSNADNILVAYNCSDANTSTIVIRFKVDASNYASATISNPAAGYNITTISKSAFTTTGSMDWGNIALVDVATTAKSAGACRVDYDGIRVEDTDTINPDYVLVARELLALPYVKTSGTSEEIEFSLAVGL